MIAWNEFERLKPTDKIKYLSFDSGTIQSLIYAQQLRREIIERIINIAEVIRTSTSDLAFMKHLSNLLNINTCALYFTQCSTRTFTSFSVAAQSLGMHIEEVRNPEMSSMYKGESELDTLLTLATLCEVIVIRQMDSTLTDRLAYEICSRNLPTRVINGGSGSDQHPTQALLDMYSLFVHSDFLNTEIKDFKVAIVGDLKRSRTARSLSYLLALYPKIKQYFIAPAELQMADDILEHLNQHSVQYQCSESLDQHLNEVDVFYMMRIQDEYSHTSEELRKAYESFYLSIKKVQLMKESACILHPLPRRLEIPIEIDKDHRAKYWDTVALGKIIRMALLLYMFGYDDPEKLQSQSYL